MDGMLSDRDRRAVQEHIVADMVAPVAQVEWVTSPQNWPTHAWFRGPSGLQSHLLASREWQEARFEEPRCSLFIVTPNDDEREVRDALGSLAQATVEYLSGRGQVEQHRGLFGRRWSLVLHTEMGEWRIGKRGATMTPPDELIRSLSGR
jgi:hypothetical protein